MENEGLHSMSLLPALCPYILSAVFLAMSLLNKCSQIWRYWTCMNPRLGVGQLSGIIVDSSLPVEAHNSPAPVLALPTRGPPYFVFPIRAVPLFNLPNSANHTRIPCLNWQVERQKFHHLGGAAARRPWGFLLGQQKSYPESITKKIQLLFFLPNVQVLACTITLRIITTLTTCTSYVH